MLPDFVEILRAISSHQLFSVSKSLRMKKFLLIILCALALGTSQAQEQEVKAVIDKMFQSMYSGDTASLRSCFIPTATLMSYTYDARGNARAKAETIQDFARGVALVGEDEFE